MENKVAISLVNVNIGELFIKAFNHDCPEKATSKCLQMNIGDCANCYVKRLFEKKITLDSRTFRLAIVEDGAELPADKFFPKRTGFHKGFFDSIQQDMLKAGFVKEIKNE